MHRKASNPMPRQNTIISIFLSSPGDVAEERERVAAVVKELNVSVARSMDVQFELITWEDYAQPGLGADAQDVINKSMPNEFDIFIGIMWHRFGTPTGRAGSGTKEEFDLAKEVYDKNPDLISFFLYFKDAPISPMKLDPEQLKRVTEFRKELETQGLYRSFDDVDSFEKLVRIHLTREIQIISKKLRSTEETVSTIEVSGSPDSSLVASAGDQQPKVSLIHEEELGFLDYIIEYEEKVEIFLESINKLSEAMNNLNNRTNDETAKIGRFVENQDNKNIALSMKSVAQEMGGYCDIAEVNIPIYASAFNDSINSFTKAIAIMASEGGIDEGQIISQLSQISDLKETISAALDGISGFREAVSATPRAVKELNKQKKRLVSVLSWQIDEFNKSIVLINGIEDTIRSMLSK
jgi:uncharacterized protein YoxC